MKTNLILIFALLSLQTLALVSPIPSSIEGIELPNTHYVSEDNLVLRSMAPKGHYEDLEKLGVSKVLIFKKQTRKEVDDEIKDLKELGYTDSDILHIPFLWHDFESEYAACVETVDGLNFILENQAAGETTLVHCTVGEDRTGHIMGLYRIIDQKWSTEKAFKEELCERGYGRGNKNKPQYVVGEVRSDLSPIFFKMAEILKEKYKPGKKISKTICRGIDKKETSIQKCRWSSVFE